jgi:hypothetical protein
LGLGKKKEETDLGKKERKENVGLGEDAVSPFGLCAFRGGIFSSLGDTSPIFPLLGKGRPIM